ncbi:hypothetical protein Tco_1332950 [Tanacetum coccineum]
MTHPHPNRRFVPQAVLTKSGKINTAGASVNTAVRPVNTAGSKPTVNHPRSISNAYKRGYSQVTRPFNKYSEYKNSIFNKKAQQKEYKEKGVIDSGCSRHMTGNKCYLTEYEDYDGGFVSFGDGKGRISGKVYTAGISLEPKLQLLSKFLTLEALFEGRKAIRSTEISQSSGPINLVAYETVYKEWEDRMEKDATTASSLDAEQDSGNINRT